MSKRFASLASGLLLVLGLAAFTGSALAGNGNGNGKASAGANANASAGAPGHLKKSSAAAGASTTLSAGGSASQNGPGTQGVKPTSATAKGTSCGPVGGSSSAATCAPQGTAATNVQSAGRGNASKRYGNGMTAAQVAVQNGGTGSILHGPGNSQPHKTALCPGGHEVDVHALKAHRQKSSCVLSAGVAATTSSAATVHGNAPRGTVLGAIQAAPKSQHAGGILGVIQAAGHGILPFTGFPLGIALLAALAMIGFGLSLRRIARPTV